MTVFRASTWLSLALTLHLTDAMVCLISQEPDSGLNNTNRWVIPVEDPCKCTEIRLGGINNRAPGRHFKVIYFDTVLTSNSPEEMRKWLNCKGSSISHYRKHTTTFTTSELPTTSDSPTTSDLSTTSNIPRTTFTCDGKADGRYSDPDDCNMYYECNNKVPYHRTCGKGTQFNQGAGQCLTDNDGNCEL